ncbi:MAG: permease [Spirochaetaceae bacterium]|nr:MAG: permease [Spirochaetaceae bacterium]
MSRQMRPVRGTIACSRSRAPTIADRLQPVAKSATLKAMHRSIRRFIHRSRRFWVIEALVVLTTLKWAILAVIAGLLAGFPTALFLLVLDNATGIVYAQSWYFFMAPAGLFLSAFIVKKLAPDATGHGTEKVIEAIHNHGGHIAPRVVPVKMIATWITLTLGGSAGKEGPSAQIGAGVASMFSSLVRMNRADRERFVLCGMSAGFSGVFGTPIAGALFAAEVLSIGRFSYNSLLPSLLASYVAFFVTRGLGVMHLTYSVDFIVSSEIAMMGKMVLFGLVIGGLAIIFIGMLHRTERLFAKIPVSTPVKGLIGGVVLIAVVLLTGTTNYVGLGARIVDRALDGETFRGIAPFFKMLTTSVTLSSGGSGGIIMPIFFIGSTAGNYWAQITGGNVGLYSAIGMVAFLAACANTPLAAIMLAMELFGVRTGSYGAIACTVSFLVVGHLSVYPSQVISIKKTWFRDIDTHGVEFSFTRTGIRKMFGSFFRGYRTSDTIEKKASGQTIAEARHGRKRPQKPDNTE